MEIKLPLNKVALPGGGVHLWIDVTCRDADINFGFVLDTGASMSVFDSKLVDRFVKNVREVDESQISSGVNAMIEDQQLGELKDMSLGEFPLDGNTVVLMNLEHIQEIYEDQLGLKMCGLLGGDFLEKYNAIIDYSMLVLTVNID
jgi:hypothetical protein